MKIDKVFTNMTQRIEDGFMEIECESMAVLRETDKEYADMQKRMVGLSEQIPFVDELMEGKGNRLISAEESTRLAEYLHLMREIETRERMHLYYLGHHDCYAYCKRIGIV